MTRFKMGQHTAIGFEIIEAPPGRIAEYSPRHTDAIARIDELNNEHPPAPAAPCCDCRETLERYWVALNKIARHSEDEYARTRANMALGGGGDG